MTLQNQHFIITGGNTGIGKAAAMQLAKMGAEITLACRSEEKTRAAMAEITAATGNSQVHFISLDLADLSSVRRCAEALLASDRKISGLINNAGMAGMRGITRDGFELIFAVNHLGPYLLTRLLLPKLLASAPSRIVNVSSKMHYSTKSIDWDAQKHSTRSRLSLDEYSVSKLCNVVFTNELARRFSASGVTSVSVHPGVVASDIWRRIPQPFRWLSHRFMISTQEAGNTLVSCATAPETPTLSGTYFDKLQPARPSKLACDPEFAQLTWQKSAEFCGLSAE